MSLFCVSFSFLFGSDRFCQSCNLDSCNSYSNLSLFLIRLDCLGDLYKYSSYNRNHHQLHVPTFIKFSAKVQLFIELFTFLHFTLAKSARRCYFFVCNWYIRFYPKESNTFPSQNRFLFVHILFVRVRQLFLKLYNFA